MILEAYIKELLYRYDCVIVPNFGGFIANRKSATINESSFEPPFKQITFNALLQNNDGLLANHIASTDKMPYETAVNYITFEVEEWIEKLMDDELNLKGIGSFSMENDTIQFEPDRKINFLTSSFGLSSYSSSAIKRNTVEENVLKPVKTVLQPKKIEIAHEKEVVVLATSRKRKTANFLKYAAIFVLSFSIIGLIGTKIYKDRIELNEIAKIKKQQEQRELEIQTATFVITNPLPSITLNTIAPIKKYHVIAGAFRDASNATKKVNQLTKKGFNATIVGKNKWNLTQVAFESYTSLEKANSALLHIRRNVMYDAWLLIKE